MAFLPLTTQEELTGKIIVDAAYKVHRALGPGLLENVYELCFCHELFKQGLRVERQVPIPITYNGINFEVAFRMDVLVDNLVVCELKSVEALHPVFYSQLLTYMKLGQKRLGYLVNFNVATIKEGVKRLIL